MEEVVIEKLVHGGQGLGELADGRKLFVWNALPGEKVRVRIIKKKRSYVEAIAEEVVEASPERIEPLEANYLATSPWQMMTYEAENRYKESIVEELFRHAHVNIPEFQISFPEAEWQYRNKMEYSFWGDDDGLHLALHQRGSHGKQIVTGSFLAMPAIDAAANAICTQLGTLQVRAGDLKTIIVRCNQKGETVASLFVKPEEFPKLELAPEVKGLRVYHSNPKSPASIATKLLYELGDATLTDELLGQKFTYDVDSFFQVNLPIFKKVLERIKEHCTDDSVVDMYSGVGSIGLSVARHTAILIENDPATAAMARVNAAASKLRTSVIESPSEQATENIWCDGGVLIFDPPRAGLHKKVIEAVEGILPPKIIYLSCNPATQARDLALLQDDYDIKYFETFNFFPRTPHIETLAVLARK